MHTIPPTNKNNKPYIKSATRNNRDHIMINLGENFKRPKNSKTKNNKIQKAPYAIDQRMLRKNTLKIRQKSKTSKNFTTNSKKKPPFIHKNNTLA